ncbi:putative membrane protein [Campylobacter iguaniorum]|uniref:hypothetical protein n=1 Tax=Campylobacter iguaniorum TaxID=1244531 RepID=UPI0007C9155B|nr:hypothetical protein [Campylobacter iguaniorum]ANE36071.1 putative membrane protein [Campylobacter iguaniorum]
MAEKDIILMLIAVMIVGVVLNTQIKRVTKRLDIEETNPNLGYYSDFCNAIDEKILMLKELVQDAKILETSDMDGCLEALSNFSKELVFIQTMNTNNKDKDLWEEKLFGFLSKLDDFIMQNMQDAKAISDEMKSDLKDKFESLSS